MSAHIKPWRETSEAATITASWDAIRLADAEIAELRAALAGDDPEPGEPFMYKMPSDYDWHIDFAPLPESAFRIKALAAAPLPQQAAGDGLIDKPVAQVIRDADGCDDIQWLVDSASGDVQPGDLLYKK